MEVLNEATIGRYGEGIEQLIERPRSIRLFNEIFAKGLDLLRNYGTGFQFLDFGKRKFEGNFDNPLREINYCGERLRLEYQRGFLDFDELKIFLNRRLYVADLKLTRARGNGLLSALERMDQVEQYSRGISIFDRDVFRLDPSRLVVNVLHDFRPESVGKTPYGGSFRVEEF